MHVEFMEETTQALFDDLYDADLIDGQPREKPFTKGKGDSKQIVPPIRRVPMTKTDKKGKETTIEGYVYRELTPALRTLRHFLPSNGDWVKLWRDLIWQIIREGRKKAPYISRAAKKGKMIDAEASAISDSKAADSDEKVNQKADGSSWGDIVKSTTAQSAGSSAVGRLSGALLLGAMAENAETVPLFSRIEHSLLLHFWPLAMLVFVPRFIDQDGESYIGKRNSKDKDPHFAIVIPDVADLKSFLLDYRRLLGSLQTAMAGFRGL